RPRRRDVPELRGVPRGLREPRAVRGVSASGSQEVAARAFKELSEAPARRWDVATDDLPGRRIEQDHVRSASVLEGREPDRGVEELRILDVRLGPGVLDDVHEILQQ